MIIAATIIALVVVGVLLIGYALCAAAQDREWHLDDRGYDESPLWRRRR